MKSKTIRSLLFLVPLCLFAGDNISTSLWVPQVAELSGQVNRYHGKTGAFVPVELTDRFTEPTLVVTSAGSEVFLSFPGKVSARVGENSRVVIGPAVNDLYEVDLRLGTVTARLDPERDRDKEPAFAIRTKDGVTRATGTYFAVTEYKGQSYAAVKKGEVKKKTTPPAQPDFAAYLKKPQPQPQPQPEKTKRSE